MKLGTTELLVILAIILVLFGPSQLPKLARMFGKSVKNVRKGMEEDDEKPAKAVTDQSVQTAQTSQDASGTGSAQTVQQSSDKVKYES